MEYFEDAKLICNLRGHIRLHVPRLYRNAVVADAIEAQLATLEGVQGAHANPLTGRVLIEPDPARENGRLLERLGVHIPARHSAGHAPAPRASRPRAFVSAPAETRGKLALRQVRPAYAAWHLRSPDEALAYFGSDALRGLSAHEAQLRLAQGDNTLPPPAPVSALALLMGQFQSLPIALLAGAALLSTLTGALAEAGAIVTVLVLNGGIGFVTEWRAQKTISALTQPLDGEARVLRDGQVRSIDGAGVVPGDILLLEPSTRVAADLRLVQTSGLQVDEAILTGESFPVEKRTAALDRQTALAERDNMGYRGTTVSVGSGRGVVVGTGIHTEVGMIQAAAHSAQRPRTPSQVQLDELGGHLIKLSTAICLGIFGLGLLRGYPAAPLFKIVVSLAIAAVPEGLPTVATTALARGIRRMHAHEVLVRRLPAVETLGAIHVICLDKTGTLTMNHMTPVALRTARHALGREAMRPGVPHDVVRLLQVGVLCSQAEAEADAPQNGSATETSLLALAGQCGVDPQALRRQYPLLGMQLRGQGRNYMSTRHRSGADSELFAVKGSPDEVLAMCGHWLDGEQTQALDEGQRALLAEQNDEMTARQLRVLGFAYAQRPLGSAETALTWIGLVGLGDPLRDDATQVIARFHEAGIRTVMLTGDQAGTAERIGQALHLNNGGELGIVQSQQLDELAPDALARLASRAHVFARVTPADKLRIVKALQANGETVAMTGDGINDGPALRAADVGIAMGGGSEAALSVADVALKTDRLDRLLDAIRHGRSISDNIRKSVHFLVSSNLSEILVVAGAVGMGAGQPLGAMQLLWLNLLTDVLPAIALATEPESAGLMQKPPQPARTPIVGRTDFQHCAAEAAALAGGTLGTYLTGLRWHGQGARAGTMAFDALVLGQLLHALVCRSSERHPAGAHADTARPNRQLTLAVAASAALQGLVQFVPALRRPLGLAPLGLADLAAVSAGAVIPMLVNEWMKPRAPLPERAADTR